MSISINLLCNKKHVIKKHKVFFILQVYDQYSIDLSEKNLVENLILYLKAI